MFTSVADAVFCPRVQKIVDDTGGLQGGLVGTEYSPEVVAEDVAEAAVDARVVAAVVVLDEVGPDDVGREEDVGLQPDELGLAVVPVGVGGQGEAATLRNVDVAPSGSPPVCR